MVDITFLFLIIATLFFGIRSLLETYSFKELAKRFGMLIMFSFIVLVSIDFSVIQQDPLHQSNSGGASPASIWSKETLPEGFRGPLGISLPPWNPFGVSSSEDKSQDTITQEQYEQLMIMMKQSNQNQIPHGEVGLGYQSEVTKTPPPQPIQPPIQPQQNGMIQEKTMEKFVSLLEQQIDRLDQQEKSQKKALSNSFKDNVKLSSSIYQLSHDAKERTNKVYQMEKDLKKISRATSGELSEMKQLELASMSQPLFRDNTLKTYKNKPGKQGSDVSYLEEISRKIDEIANKGKGGDGGSSSGGSGSNKALRNAQLEVERLRAERSMLLNSKATAETNLEQLQSQVTLFHPYKGWDVKPFPVSLSGLQYIVLLALLQY